MAHMPNHPKKASETHATSKHQKSKGPRSTHGLAPLIEPDLDDIAAMLTPLPDHLEFAANAVREVIAGLTKVRRRLR